jgi:hypothetical protein
MDKWPELRRNLAWVLLALVGLILGAWIGGSWIYRRVFVAAFIGAAVGIGEIVSRYRDAPERALRTPSAWLYISINAIASAAAMCVVWYFGLGVAATGPRTMIQQILLAGFGAMALFRTSVFTVRVADQDIGIGPVVFLQVVLRATDRAVDRIRADARAAAVSSSMAGVSFARAQAALPAFCLALMQNVPADEQNSVGTATKALIGSKELDDETKTRNLGLALMNVVGDKVLQTAVTHLAQQIQKTDRITITGVPPSLAAAGTADAVATCEALKNVSLPGRRVTWSSDTLSVATITSNGHVIAVARGKTIIRAASDDAEAYVPLEVT